MLRGRLCNCFLTTGFLFVSETRPAIAHRDIKPNNIFLRRGDRITCVIGDFGYALCARRPDTGNNNDSSPYEFEYQDTDSQAELTQRTVVGTIQ